MAFKRTGQEFVKKFFLSIFGVLFAAVTMTLTLSIYIPFCLISLLYKRIIIVIAKFKIPSATILRSVDQQMTNSGGMYKATHNYITFTAILEGKLNEDVIKDAMMKNLINKRCPNGKLQFPQMQQHIIKFAGFDFWEWDKSFDLNNCIFLHGGKEDVTKEKLLEIRLKFQQRLFPKGHVLWEALLVPNYQRSDSSGDKKDCFAFIFKFHHGFSDGFSVMKLLWKHLANNPYTEPMKPSKRKPNYCETTLRFLLFPILVIKTLYQYPFDFVYNRDRLLDNNHWHTHVERDKRKFEVWVAEPMNKKSFREIKAAHDVSTMSVIVTIILGGIRRMMLQKNLALPKYMRVGYPIPIGDHPDYLTNHATMLEFLAPVANENSTQRLLKTDENIKKAHLGPFAITLRFLTWLSGHLPYQFQKVSANYKLCSVCIPCVPLPTGEGYFFDCRILEVSSVFYSTQADCGTCVSILGYNNQFHMVLQIESTLLDRPDEVKLLENYILEELHSLAKDIKV